MELRICSCDADIRALAALATEIWHEYFTAIISKEQIDYMVEKFQIPKEKFCLPDSRFRRRKVIFAMRNFMRKARPATIICWMAG